MFCIKEFAQEGEERSMWSHNRFVRTEQLIGEAGVQVLSASKVAIFGLGGVGSYAAEALARSGIGTLNIIDFDCIDESNINRQLLAMTSTLGQPKVEVMAKRIHEINPEATVTPFNAFYSAESSHLLISDDLDYVVDAIDSVDSKIHLIKTCVERGIPIISSMGAGNRLDPTAFKVDDISRTHSCPLARAVRHNLRQIGIKKGVKVVFSAEPSQVCHHHPPSSISFVPPVVGFIMCSVVVKELLAEVTIK